MTNTINNLPRELKPCPFCGGDAETDTHTEECYFTVSKDMRAKVAHNADMSLVSAVLRAWNQRAPSPGGVEGWDVAGDILEKLSAAQAIIDGLRGEVDQQAQRIGELASHLEFAVTLLTVAGLAGNAQVEAMRAALSAGVGMVK